MGPGVTRTSDPNRPTIARNRELNRSALARNTNLNRSTRAASAVGRPQPGADFFR